jgi:putative ABC transport system permease protein
MDALRYDLRHAFRVLAKSPTFTLAAVVTLGLGIAANTTIFGLMNALLLRPFPLLDEGRLVFVWERHPQEGAPFRSARRRRASPGLFSCSSRPRPCSSC